VTDDPPTDASDAPGGSDGTVVDRVRSHVSEHRTGMLHDLMFAVVWVGLVSLLFDTVFAAAPTWAYYLVMAAGIPAYFGFFASLEAAKESQAGE